MPREASIDIDGKGGGEIDGGDTKGGRKTLE